MSNSVLSKFLAIESEMNTVLFERTNEIRGLVIGAVAPGGRHLYYLGEPGVGKSLLVTQFTARITGAVKFETLLMRTSLPEQVFGPVDLQALQAGKFRRVPTGKVQEAHWAFGDECFKANSAILNSLLRVLNERVYDDGGNPQKIPLISFIGASNELPQGEDLNAMYDRLHLRYVVHRIMEDANFEKLLTMTISPPKATVTLDDVLGAQKEVGAVKVNGPATTGIKQIRLGCDKQGVRVSDRKWRESVAILQAEAWLNGVDEVRIEDLGVLQHVLWSTPEERKKVVDVVFGVACPAMPRALEIVDLVMEQRQICKQDPGKLTESYKTIRSLSKEIEDLTKNMTKFPQLKDALDKVKRVRAEVGELVVKG